MKGTSRYYDPGQEGAGSGGTPTALPAGTNVEAGKTEDLFEVTVNGETKKVPLEELRTRYQKEAAADEKFRAAAEKEKRAENALRLEQDIVAMRNNDEGAFRRVGGHFGWSQEQIEAALVARRKAQTLEALGVKPGAAADDDDDDDAGEAKGARIDVNAIAAQVAEKLLPLVSKQVRVGVDQLDPRLRQTLMGVVNQNVGAYLQVGVDNDPFLATFKRDGTPEQVSAIHRVVQEEASRRASAGKDLTNPAEVHDVIQTAKTYLQSLGLQPARKPVPMGGLGSGGTSGPTLHQSEKPLERPASGLDSSAADDYILDMLVRAQMEGAAG